jgi:hypothetical protein
MSNPLESSPPSTSIQPSTPTDQPSPPAAVSPDEAMNAHFKIIEQIESGLAQLTAKMIEKDIYEQLGR